jgi:hypothetical protein
MRTRAHGDGIKQRAPIIAEFLDWDLHRVEEALAEIGEIEDPETPAFLASTVRVLPSRGTNVGTAGISVPRLRRAFCRSAFA